LALARKGDAESIRALAKAGALRGPAGQAARDAMLAIPPRLIEAILFEPAIELDSEPPVEKRAGPKPSGEASKKDKQPADAPSALAKADAAERRSALNRKVPRVLTAPVIQFLGDLGDLRAMRALRA